MPAESAAVFYDGASARRREVVARLGETLDIIESDGATIRWALADIRGDGARAKTFRSAVGPELARLTFEDPAFAALLASRCPRLGEGERRSAWPVVGWSLAAAASIGLMIAYLVPWLSERLAPYVPVAAERRLGDIVDRQVRSMMDGEVCAGADGARALAKLAARLESRASLHLPLTIRVLDNPLANAVALPGGRIYIFRGLLDRAPDVDGLAGVLGHEIAHVANRDATRGLIRAGGTSFLLGLLFGDVTGAGAIIFAGRVLLDSSHSREAETDADAYAADLMTALGRPTRPMGALLTSIAGDDDARFPVFLRSHPVTRERMEALGRRDQGATGAPLLSDEEWKALKSICAPATR